MEYYHLHTKGVQDKLWKVKREFVVDEQYKNRLYWLCHDFTTTTPSCKFPNLVNHINLIYEINGYAPLDEFVSVDDLLSCHLNSGIGNDQLKELLMLAQETIYSARIFKREMALEEFRKNNVPSLPSRMHSLYVTTEEGITYWENVLLDNDLDVYRLDLEEEPFATNEQLLPDEGLSYSDTYKESKKYWCPELHDSIKYCNEYLAQGRVRILEKVAEIKR
jgi:hypothetical protein